VKLITFMSLMLISSMCFAGSLNNSTALILNGATTTATGTSYQRNGPQAVFQCYGATTAGAGSATILIEVSALPTPAATLDWVTAGTITLAALATTRTTDGFAMNAPWKWARARVTAISGTNATVSCYMGKNN
jgi:hypothetical protein